MLKTLSILTWLLILSTNLASFAAPQFTWKCQERKCVKILSDDDEQVSLNTCNMMCSELGVWPKPVSFQITNKDASVIDRTKISFEYANQGSIKVMLENATELFMKSLEFLKPTNQTTPGTELNIRIVLFDSETDKLRLNTNESYQLSVYKNPKLTATINAQNYFGARHALETLTQLIWYDEFMDDLRILHDVDITDFPKFPYRGVMIDTARNYFPLSMIKKVVDGMAMAKLNVLHLHLTDAVSFPIVLPRVKQLAANGAYGPDMIYTPEDIKDLVKYALFRGIRIVLEVDAPSHVNAGWNYLQSRLNKKFVICGETDVFNGHLNPDNDAALTLLEEIYTDLLELSENDEIFHMGSDEVNLTCWKNTESVKNSNSAQNMKSFWRSYTNRMLERVKNANGYNYPEHVVMWSSPLTESTELEKLDKKVTVQHWLGNPYAILNNGHKVIYSTVGYWYLDCGFNIWRSSMTRGNCDPYTPWQKFYSHRPWITNGFRELALGGEVCLWTEQVEVDSLETRIWPRSAAFAERIWSDPSRMDEYDVYTRLVSFSERLKSKGIKTSAMWPRWCSQNPGKC